MSMSRSRLVPWLYSRIASAEERTSAHRFDRRRRHRRQGRRRRRSRPRPTASPRSGTPASSPATRSSRWRSPAGRRRGSSSARRCCRPTRATRCCRRTGRPRSSTPWAAPGSPSASGPSHEPLIRGVFGSPTTTPGAAPRSTCGSSPACCAATPSTSTATTGPRTPPAGPSRPPHPVPVLVSALGPRLLRVAGELADGTVLWMAPARAIETHVVPKITRRGRGGRPPRAAHRRRPPGRGARRRSRGPRRGGGHLRRCTPGMANYQRILEIGGAPSPADAAIVGDETAGARAAAVAPRRRRHRHLGGGLPGRRRPSGVAAANDATAEGARWPSMSSPRPAALAPRHRRRGICSSTASSG